MADAGARALSGSAGARFEVVADELDDDGRGVGRAGALELHVDDLLPGERGEVVVEHRSPHRSVAWARLAHRTGPLSCERAEPVCPAFGSCGGCPWQHLSYPGQLELKRRRLEGLLSRPVTDVVPSPRQTEYRNRGKYVVGQSSAGPVLGAYAPRSRRVVDTAGCRVVAAPIERVADRIRALLRSGELRTAGWPDSPDGLRYTVCRCDADGRVLVGLVTTSATERGQLVKAADALAGEPVVGVVRVVNDRSDGVLLTDDVELLWGRDALEEVIGPVRVELGIGEFSQVNREQAARIYRDLVELTDLGAGAAAADLYCGVGGIAFSLAVRGVRVHGIEVDGAAVKRAREAARQFSFDGLAEFSAGDASELAALRSRHALDLVVVNPPRKGLSSAALAAVADAGPGQIAYVSCNPATLARDSAALADRRYRCTDVRGYDLMPGTSQVEALALFRR